MFIHITRDGRAVAISWLAQMVLSVIFLLTAMNVQCQPMNDTFVAADKYASLADIEHWANSKAVRGFGYPESFEYTSAWGAHIYVTWNDPYSGRAAVYSNAFVRSKDGTIWNRVDTSLFESPDPLAFAYFNTSSRTLIFVGRSGENLKSVQLSDRDKGD